MEYDEIRITTRREIDICDAAIRKLERCIGGYEKKYGMTSADLLNSPDASTNLDAGDLTRWRESCLTLYRWKERLKEHLEIMNM